MRNLKRPTATAPAEAEHSAQLDRIDVGFHTDDQHACERHVVPACGDVAVVPQIRRL